GGAGVVNAVRRRRSSALATDRAAAATLPRVARSTRAPLGRIRCCDHIRSCQRIANMWTTVLRSAARCRPAQTADGIATGPCAGVGRQWDDGVVRRDLRIGLHGTLELYQQPSGAAAPIVQAVGSSKLRALLAALLMDTGRVDAVGALKDVLWGGTPPPSA